MHPDRRGTSELLTTDEMARVDRLMAQRGVPGSILMDRAGAAVAAACETMLGGASSRILVLCGPGNNGGDGIVAAGCLVRRGHRVRLALLGDPGRLGGDAAAALAAWHEPVEAASVASFDQVDLIVDGLFGAGLSRPLDGEAAALVDRVNASRIPVLAIDIPSGLDGNRGTHGEGPAIRAAVTVTFFRYKPGHLLLPGRGRCGTRILADIGIEAAVLPTIAPQAFVNGPDLWIDHYPWPTSEGHKYTRGHALVLSGGATTTGAARMSARAALRVGAGLVTVASPTEALSVNAAHLTAIMLKACDAADDLTSLLADTRKNAVVLGPGLGVGARTRALVECALAPKHPADPLRSVVLDADALTSFAGDSATLRALILTAPGPVIVTPHDGEFAKLFGADAPSGSRLERARAGAARLGATMLLKGPDTVVAEPNGRATIAEADAPWLATAGSGDVLSGLVCGLLGQGMPAFEAASAAVYIHAAAARHVGIGLIAEDLPDALPPVLSALHRTTRTTI
ncbi:NAD(P)H-hydrate dehydratase [Lichenihabitans sp. PAMC28606]|uniref:NAD(P)H-hydrate dehydratase n=1 Tax=Lichenihabitans sp. PAMC28606 TaxID=2880932 RepID=UPI001D0BD462|nr:NAD(P)H-hydrate dehydratase [Lichenihabitans sp. PAMC28606]UDL95168.1 NAD(P)H-hydrate dehydratase [Lichenihabitans sp. PAMC28606]